MVPVCWALASADVKAGTARAARIAIIAITTSNSISVNAVSFLRFIFIFDFYAAVVLRVFLQPQHYVAVRIDTARRLEFSEGFGFQFVLGFFLRIFSLRGFVVVFYSFPRPGPP